MRSLLVQRLITLLALLSVGLTLAQLWFPVSAQQALTLEIEVEAPMPPGFTPLSVAIHGEEGVAVAGVDEGGVMLLYYSHTGVLQWSLRLDGIEPVSVISSDGYIHVITRARSGATEIVHYYRVTAAGEVVQEYETVVAKASLVYHAVRVPLGFVLVGAKHGGDTGWNPMAALLIPGTGISWMYESILPGDQEPVKPALNGVSVCTLYIDRGFPGKALLVCLDSATGEPVQEASLALEGATGKPLLLPGPCIVYPEERGLGVIAGGGGPSRIALKEAPERLTAAALASPQGGTAAVLLGILGGSPWTGIAPIEGQCPSGAIASGVLGTPGLLPVDADALGGAVAVAFASSQGPPLVVLATVTAVEASGSQGLQPATETRGGGASQEGGASGGLLSALASPKATAALLAALLAILAVSAALRRRRSL